MIGADEHSPRRQRRQMSRDRRHDELVDPLDRPHLLDGVPLVARLVGGLDMDADEIGVSELRDRRPPLGGVVGVEIAGRPRHLEALPAGQRRQAPQQIDRRDHRRARAEARGSIFLGKRLHPRGPPRPPQPDVRGGALAGSDPGRVERMPGEPAGAGGHEVGQKVAAGAARESVEDRLIDEIVGGRGPEIGAEWCLCPGGATVEKEITVADAGGELPAGEVGEVGGEPLLAGGQERRRFFGRDMPGGEILHHAGGDRDEVTAHGPVIGPQLDPLGGCLERRPAGEEAERVVAEEAHAGHLGARGKAVGDVVGEPDVPARGECVEGRRARGLERRQPPERGLGGVGGAVGNHDHVLHPHWFPVRWWAVMVGRFIRRALPGKRSSPERHRSGRWKGGPRERHPTGRSGS